MLMVSTATLPHGLINAVSMHALIVAETMASIVTMSLVIRFVFCTKFEEERKCTSGGATMVEDILVMVGIIHAEAIMNKTSSEWQNSLLQF